MLPTLTELQKTFDGYNEKYFNSELPKVSIKYNERLKIAGRCMYEKNECIYLVKYKTYTKYTIELGRSYHLYWYKKDGNWKELKSTLLHEMIHIKHKGHGKDFKNKLNEIIKKGGNVNRYAKPMMCEWWEVKKVN